MLMSELFYSLPGNYLSNEHELILTGSWQYGTAHDESDLDLVLLHTYNMEKDVLNVKSIPPFGEEQFTCYMTTQDGISREADIRVMSCTNFIRKLYKGDINCVEYICSPHYKRPSDFLDQANKIFFKESLPGLSLRMRVLKSIMGFLNPMTYKKSKKFIIPEKVNPNNLIKISNLFFLIRNYRYPLNPEESISAMIDPETGEVLTLTDTSAPGYNNAELMTKVLEEYKQKLMNEEEEVYYGGQSYEWLLERKYGIK